ncbi:MAG TPA: LacI family DNA-binding transcriptional regulator [Mobilitalea sp.]|nr:LacI family DNA-binding transcriptional regulator [Mobilitalea sp.]
MTTINDVAKLAKVAKSTVSNCLNGTKNVSPEIRERVMAACRQLDYIPSLVASTLVTKRTNVIGLFLGTNNKYERFFGDLIKGVMISASEIGYKTLLYYSVNQQEMSSNLHSKSLIDGAILLAPLVDDFRIKLISEDNIPFVIIGRPKEDLGYYYIDVDNVTITFEVTQRLIKLGHRKILFFNYEKDYTISIDRNEGFEQALHLYRINKDNCKVIHADNEGNTAYAYLKEHLNKDFEYTAIIVPSDIAGARVYEICKEREYAIGKDISVAALGGNSVATTLEPSLTTMVQNYEEMAKQCVELLNDQLSGIPVTERYLHSDYKIVSTDSCAGI